MWAKYVAILLLLALGVPVLAQTSTPTPVPTVPPDLSNQMATAAAQANQLPSDITQPNGVQSVVPNAEAAPLFSYIKWLFSYNSAQELLGPTLAPLGVNMFVILTIVMLLFGIYLVVNLITLILRFVIWIMSIIWKVLQLIPFI